MELVTAPGDSGPLQCGGALYRKPLNGQLATVDRQVFGGIEGRQAEEMAEEALAAVQHGNQGVQEATSANR
jgi:hypothetical protein